MPAFFYVHEEGRGVPSTRGAVVLTLPHLHDLVRSHRPAGLIYLEWKGRVPQEARLDEFRMPHSPLFESPDREYTKTN